MRTENRTHTDRIREERAARDRAIEEIEQGAIANRENPRFVIWIPSETSDAGGSIAAIPGFFPSRRAARRYLATWDFGYGARILPTYDTRVVRVWTMGGHI